MMEWWDETIRDAHSSALEASLISDVHRRAVWILNLVMVRISMSSWLWVITAYFNGIRNILWMVYELLFTSNDYQTDWDATHNSCVLNNVAWNRSLSSLRAAAPSQRLPQLVQAFRPPDAAQYVWHGCPNMNWFPKASKIHCFMALQ